jgi:hypothetical protein
MPDELYMYLGTDGVMHRSKRSVIFLTDEAEAKLKEMAETGSDPAVVSLAEMILDCVEE